MGRQFVVGDIHGAFKALLQCFDKAGFSYDDDQLICLGDVCDGWPQVRESIDELLKIKNRIFIKGIHDQWALLWMVSGDSPDIWLVQGGIATVLSYPDGVPDEHIQFLSDALLYYENDGNLFVHGGFDPTRKIDHQPHDILLWDRTLIVSAWKKRNKGVRLTDYKTVFVGHTPTFNFINTKPIKACEIWLLDTGAGWSGGCLTMMNVETGVYYQSEVVDSLYPGYVGRRSHFTQSE